MNTADTPSSRRGNAGILPWIGSLFVLKPDQFHPALGLIVAVILFVPLLILEAAGHAELWLSFSFAVLFTAISDAVVKDAYSTRVRWSVAIVLVGAGLTALGYLLGGANWGLVTVAVFVSTLLSYLAGALGRRGAVAGVLLNVSFLIALSVTFGLDKSPAGAWPLVGPQALAWLAGGGLWIVVAWILWMVRRARRPTPEAAQDQDTRGPGMSRSLVLFAGLAAGAGALATAVAWGFDLPNAVWMPAAALIAMRPGLEASSYIAGQRVAGAVLGALLAGLLLTFIHQPLLLVVVLVVMAALGVALHEVNYAYYCACIATAVLIGLGLSHPGNLEADWERVAWTLAGIGIALAVMLLASVAAPRSPARAPSAQEATIPQQPGDAAPA